jgi:hypothetical protein
MKLSRFGLVCCIAISLAYSGCGGETVTPDKTDVVLIFADVTNSLVSEENKEVSRLAARVLDSLTGGTQYAIYPILRETQRPSLIKKGEIYLDADAEVNRAAKKARQKELADIIENLYTTTNNFPNSTSSNGKEDENRTCILNTLGFAENYFSQYKDSSKYDLQLIFISDMIEECNSTPLNRRIKMDKENISEEIDLAQKCDISLNLSNVNITIIIPSTPNTAKVSAGRRPSREHLMQFWSNIFRHCQFTEEMLKNSDRFYFSVGLPDRFRSIDG